MINPLAVRPWRGWFTTALATVAGLSVVLPTVASAAGADAEAGRKIFQQHCTACHTVGGGNLVGPDLKGVTAKRPREWLKFWISAPDAMLAGKDPIAMALLHEFHEVPMPNLHLGASDVNAVLAYLETTAPGTPAQPAASATAARGDAEIGKDLFTGVAGFHNGGPPCMACHSVAGIGALGGGQLGPDLTDVVMRFGGAAATAAFVGGSPTPTMSAIWSIHPLTAEERENVVAFLAQATVKERPPEAIWQLAGLAVLGLVFLLAIAAGIWRHRLRDGVRRPMIARQRISH